MEKQKKDKEDLIYTPPYSMPEFILSTYVNNYNKKVKRLIENEIEENNFNNENINYKFLIGPPQPVCLGLDIGEERYNVDIGTTNFRPPNRIYLNINFPKYSIGDKILYHLCQKSNLEKISLNEPGDYMEEETLKLNYLYLITYNPKYINPHQLYGEYTKSSALIKTITQVSNILNQYNSFLEENKELVDKTFEKTVENNKNFFEESKLLEQGTQDKIEALNREISRVEQNYRENSQKLTIQKEEEISTLEQKILSKLQ